MINKVRRHTCIFFEQSVQTSVPIFFLQVTFDLSSKAERESQRSNIFWWRSLLKKLFLFSVRIYLIYKAPLFVYLAGMEENVFVSLIFVSTALTFLYNRIITVQTYIWVVDIIITWINHHLAYSTWYVLKCESVYFLQAPLIQNKARCMTELRSKLRLRYIPSLSRWQCNIIFRVMLIMQLYCFPPNDDTMICDTTDWAWLTVLWCEPGLK